jgi:glycosyltransferase involved in cell wall biosynthesis
VKSNDGFDITVVIPTFNRHHYIDHAIASCFNGNADIRIEVVVVDDGSTDGTRSKLKSLENPVVRPIFQNHQGGQVARNRGLDAARGRYVKFLDDDDWLAAGALSKEVRMLDKHDADVCYGHFCKVDDDGAVLAEISQPRPDDLVSRLFRGADFTIPLNVTYRRAFVQPLRWDPELPCRQDYAFLLEAALREPSHIPSGVRTGFKREHDSQQVASSNSAFSIRTHTQILRRAVRHLIEEDRLVGDRRDAALEGLWTWAHVASAYDRAMFNSTYDLITEIEPGFKPNRPSVLLSTADRYLGPKTVETLLHPFRRVYHHG